LRPPKSLRNCSSKAKLCCASATHGHDPHQFCVIASMRRAARARDRERGSSRHGGMSVADHVRENRSIAIWRKHEAETAAVSPASVKVLK
jgi:hypothetical protein